MFTRTTSHSLPSCRIRSPRLVTERSAAPGAAACSATPGCVSATTLVYVVLSRVMVQPMASAEVMAPDHDRDLLPLAAWRRPGTRS